MRVLLLRSLAVLVAVVIASRFALVEFTDSGDWLSLIVFAVGVALINAVIGPVLKVISFPVTVLTLGIWILVLNGLLFWLGTALLPGVELAESGRPTLLSAMLVALIISVVSFAVNRVVKEDEDKE
ncbi:MAG: phage holin family protein [Chloroflexi bacterium]|nr:phage holin family protein [Chloroflexota bacterium]